MSWTGCQNNPIYLNFYLQKSLESFEKNSADKMWFNKNSRWKVPCTVLDRVNTRHTYIFVGHESWSKSLFLTGVSILILTQPHKNIALNVTYVSQNWCQRHFLNIIRLPRFAHTSFKGTEIAKSAINFNSTKYDILYNSLFSS